MAACEHREVAFGCRANGVVNSAFVTAEQRGRLQNVPPGLGENVAAINRVQDSISLAVRVRMLVARAPETDGIIVGPLPPGQADCRAVFATDAPEFELCAAGVKKS